MATKIVWTQIITSNFSRHLKAVEFQVAEDTVVILVRNVKYPAEGSNTQWFELGEITQDKSIITHIKHSLASTGMYSRTNKYIDS